MIDQRVAREYAQALFEASEEKGKIEEVSSQLKAALEILNEQEFSEFFLAPNIEAEQKKLVFNKAFQDLDVRLRNFFWLVFDNKREELLAKAAEEFERLFDEYRRRVVATVATAVELPEDLFGMIRAKLEGTLGKEVILKPEIDPDLVGGYVLRVGDRVIDASIKARIRDLQGRLVGLN